MLPREIQSGGNAMGTVTAADWRRGGRTASESRFEGRQEIITQAARVCFERKGVRHTSVADITREVSITRELFYYYYSNKAEVADAVIATYRVDAANLLAECLRETEGAPTHEVLVAVMGALRAWLATSEQEQVSMLEILRETARMPDTFFEVAGLAVTDLRMSGVISCSEAEATGVRYALTGSMNAMLAQDGLSDDTLAGAIEALLN